MIFKLGLCYKREWHIYTKERMQGGMCSGTRLGGKGQELGYNGDLPVRRYRDGDMGRGVIHRGWNSSIESKGNGA